MILKFASKTDIGRQRRTNQDSYAVGELPVGVAWAVVCDGMGGTNGGSIASTLAVKTISEQISTSWRQGMGPNSIVNMLKSSVTAANMNVFDMSQSVESLQGMGTTVVAVIVCNNTAHIVHAGDSRAYRITKDGIKQITRDHSIVQTMIETGKLTEAEARVHPRKNVITRALGVSESLDVDYNEIDLGEGEGVLICTDGLTNFVLESDINKIIAETPFFEYPEKLINSANENGGGDNITVVAISR